jgi:hypothetical protein
VFMGCGIFGPADIDRRVLIRLNRRSILTRSNPALCTYYVHENALLTPVSSAQVMYEQMLHLLFLGSRPQCSIRVVLRSAGARGMVEGSFQMFGYPEGSQVVCVQHETTSEFLESKEQITAYRTVLNRVASVALDDTQSRQFIVGVASDYERQGAAQHDSGAGVAEEQL